MLWKSAWCFMKTVPGVVLIFAIGYLIVLDIKTGETISSWVQAIGSVVAILVAAHIAREDRSFQQHQVKKRARVACTLLERKVTLAIYYLERLNEAILIVSELHTEIAEADLKETIAEIELKLVELRSFNAIELPNAEVVTALLDAILALEAAKFHAEHAEHYVGVIYEKSRGPLSSLVKTIKEAHAVIRAHSAQTGDHD